MSLLAPAALILLAALPVLLWLAWQRPRLRRLEVGTLMLWQRVAQSLPPQSARRRRPSPLLLLLLAAAALGAIGAARPALIQSAPTPTVAVYVESLGGDEPGLEDVVQRARGLAPEAQFRVWFAGEPGALGQLGEVRPLNAAPVNAEIAQFTSASRGASARLLFLCSPDASDFVVAPRVSEPREGVIFELRSEGKAIFVRMSAGPAPVAEGASFRGAQSEGREYTREYAAGAPTVRVGDYTLQRRPFSLAMGTGWESPRHRALAAALQPGPGEPQLWLGGDGTPGIRVNQGRAADTSIEATFDSGHALFHELPLSQIVLGNRLLESAPGRRALASAAQGGDLVQLSADGRVLYFAGDPFAESSVSAAALLLDNAIGVVTGTRPSETSLYRLTQGELPTRRQAMAEPFEIRGQLQPRADQPQTTEATPWLLIMAALLAASAAIVAARRTI